VEIRSRGFDMRMGVVVVVGTSNLQVSKVRLVVDMYDNKDPCKSLPRMNSHNEEDEKHQQHQQHQQYNQIDHLTLMN
jgi:hypothetical protein